MKPEKTRPSRQAGVAILFAMLVVTLVASFAAVALWQQSSSADNESAERNRMQAALIHAGMIDWASRLLNDDSLEAGSDHLGEAWAKPLEAGQLSLFLSQDNQTDAVASRAAGASGQLSDLQARLNVMNLIEEKKVSLPAKASFERLFELLGLPQQQLEILVDQLLKASQLTAEVAAASVQDESSSLAAASSQTALMPRHVDQLAWVGISPGVLLALRPYITLLPVRTPVNLNTASAEVIYASTPDLQLAEAKVLVATRDRLPFQSLEEANRQNLNSAAQFTQGAHSVKSQYFAFRSTLQLDQTTTQMDTILRRNDASVVVIWGRAGAPLKSLSPPGN